VKRREPKRPFWRRVADAGRKKKKKNANLTKRKRKKKKKNKHHTFPRGRLHPDAKELPFEKTPAREAKKTTKQLAQKALQHADAALTSSKTKKKKKGHCRKKVRIQRSTVALYCIPSGEKIRVS